MLTIESLTKSYGGERTRRRATERVFAVSDVSFEVLDGELFTLLGPSGCGKTTTLRSVAGLEKPDSGRILLQDRVLFDAGTRTNVSANRRGLGMVFQSYAIWPHMTVFNNVAFPLQVKPKRPPRAQVREQVLRVLEATELAAFVDRPATALSGGQQQRLALARALVTRPDLMLLDEPLSNLDAKLRETMWFELKRLQRELGVTTVYVTHDQNEALAMSSRIAVMNGGKIEQIGKPREIYTQPASRFVAEFIGTSNFLTATVGSRVDGLVRLDTAHGSLWTSGDPQAPEGGEVLVTLRPESLSISASQPDGHSRNEWRGTVVNRAFMGDSVDHVVGFGKLELRVRCNPAVSIPPQTEIYLRVDPTNVIIVPSA
jgi:iron(III) transport system ATP-binding protein